MIAWHAGGLGSLTKLSLRGCLLGSLPQSLVHAKRLQRLSLSFPPKAVLSEEVRLVSLAGLHAFL